MRRSTSTSNIPLPKSEVKNRGRSSVRSGLKDPRDRGSTDRLTATNLKRSSSLSNFRTPVVAGVSKLSYTKKSIGATPTLGGSVKPSHAKRSSGTTPTVGRLQGPLFSSNHAVHSSGSRSKSPYKIGSERTSDKKWVSEQYSKVRRYLQEYTNCEDYILQNLKPPTLNTFARVINLLLKEIHPRIEINTTNYKDVVLNTLKTLHYPGNVSNSLLKTVNTMHAWPQVISIFGWLVDVIMVIKKVDLPVSSTVAEDPKYQKYECILDYVIKKYAMYNNNSNDQQEAVDKEFADKFAKILNIDEEEINGLKKEVDTLTVLKEKQMKQINEQKKRNDEIRSEIEKIQNNINMYYETKGTRRDDLECDNRALKARRERLVAAIQKRRENISALAKSIEQQPCTLEEKKKMLQHIDEMKHTIALRKEKIREQKALKGQYETILAEAKRKVESEVYRLNTSLMKLTILEPELKILNLKENDFLSENFAKEVQSFIKNIKVFENKFKHEISHLKNIVPKYTDEITALKHEVESRKEKIQKMNETKEAIGQEIEKLNNEIELICKQSEERKKLYLEKMKQLDENDVNVEEVHGRLQAITEKYIQKEAAFEELKKQSLDFFVKLHDAVMGNLQNINEIRTDILETLADCLKRQMEHAQNEIIQDLHHLDKSSNKKPA